ncbi:hypothetical protein [Chromobacterium paludis]|uniref:Uncharacterized protein n=1 Tax=Chromobacterium paludis TaxID=2605945 RepID=A0A5C1DIV3_9NEIS|nr:hypothetical protein [Chromobacterium paludis]QEL56604.1 hypothetical protein FYK34_14035 [Chromobacterium paludis]
MAQYLENSLTLLADHHQAFQQRTADAALCDLAASHAEMLQADVAITIAMLGELVLNYGAADTGEEVTVLQHMGHALRLMGEVARFAELEGGVIATARALPTKGELA